MAQKVQSYCVSQTKFPVKEFEDLKQTKARLSPPELRPDPVQNTYQAFFSIHFRRDQWRTEGGFGCSNPPPEIPKALQNCDKLNRICENC